MSRSLRIGPFRGLWSATGGEAPEGFAGAMLNARVGDGTIRPRYGYRNLAAAPAGFGGVFGLECLSGYDATSHKFEWVSIEARSGTIKPYSVDPTIWARTEITDGATPLDLQEGLWRGFFFDAESYWINPDSTPSLFRHTVKDNAIWVALQDSLYVPPPVDPTILVDVGTPVPIPFTSGDTIAVSGPGVTTPTFLLNNGVIEVSGNAGNNSQTSANSIVTVTFAAAVDMSRSDYIGLKADGQVVYIRFKTGVLLEVKIGGAWSIPDQQPFLNDERTVTGVVARLRGTAGTNAVQAIRFTVRAEPQPSSTGRAYDVSTLKLGGSYIAATAAGDRPWDPTYRTETTTYGVRYRELAGGTFTGIKAAITDESRFGRTSLDATLTSSLLADRVAIEVEPLLSGGYSDDPTGTSYVIDYVRKDVNGVWRLLGTKPNTTGQQWFDQREEHELAAIIPPVDPGDYVEPDPVPVFETGQIVSGFAFKGGVVWLYKGGRSNVKWSRTGNALALANPSDDLGDEARGATFTLSDNLADEPVGGIRAGDVAIIAGKEGIYGQAGQSPSTMTPPRQLPGSMGCAGRYAFVRHYDEGGNPGMAWLDTSGENVWFASAGLVYSGDTQARPVEISAPIRGSLRRFLLTEQQEALPDVDLSLAQLEVDEATGSLWVFLGKRAAILRPPSLIDGQRQWELCDFALGSTDVGAGTGDPVPGTSAPFGPTTGTDEARGGATLAWTSPNSVIAGTGVASAGAFLPGLLSHWLRGNAFAAIPQLAAEATLTSLTLRVRHRAVSAGEAPTPVGLQAIDGFKGGVLKQSLAPATGVPSVMTDVDFGLNVATMAADVPALNDGLLDFRLGYDASPTSGAVSVDGNWTVVVSPPQYHYHRGSVSSTQVMTATATWTGGGVAPAFCFLSLTATAAAGGAGGESEPGAIYFTNYTGSATVSNGIGQTDTGAIMAPTPDPPPGERTAMGTKKFVVPVSGGVATQSVTMSGSSTVSPGDTQDGWVSFSLAAEITESDPTTVEVESVHLIAGYTIPGAAGERSVTFLAFGPGRNLVWERSSGQLDAAEWCPSCLNYVQGSNRDGGLPMPEGYWESARLKAGARRLTRVEVEREGFDALDLIAYTERSVLGVVASAPASQRWARFGIGSVGTAHRIRVRVPETLVGVNALDLVFVATSGPDR